ncbi:MAG: hypothetical protein JO235_08965 [Chroococcidiopsidaceae cyanobacterium CP_BM_RX_35]|nr:hypothetical protein [Chroococcidiopsidaceae cyanobacterium CP_BM_RX_35]
MALIKIKNLVINTNYIAAVRLGNQDCSEGNSVFILLATPGFPPLQDSPNGISQYQYEWLEFKDREADVLRDYFDNFNYGVADLMLQH